MSDASSIPPFVADDLRRMELTLDPAQLAQLAAYLDHLLEVNQRINLTGIRDRDEAWRRHVIDSLTLLPGLEALPTGTRIIDVGSGGGLPGIPIAIARPDLAVTLSEATGKKAKFLEECTARLGLANVTVLNARAEHLGQDPLHRQGYDVAACRALGPMRELLEYTLPLVKVGGFLLAMKGPSVEAELEAAGDAMDKLGGGEIAVYEAYPDGFDNRSLIVRIDKDRPTPRSYPRAPGTPRQSPL